MNCFRHLLVQRLPPKEKKEVEAKKKVDTTKKEYKPLRLTGNEELDKLFERCYNPLKRAGSSTVCHLSRLGADSYNIYVN